MSRSEGTGRGVDVGTAGLGCSTTTVGVAVGSGRAVGGVSLVRQAIRETIAPQAIAPAIMVDCRIVPQIAKRLGKTRKEEFPVPLRMGAGRPYTGTQLPKTDRVQVGRKL